MNDFKKNPNETLDQNPALIKKQVTFKLKDRDKEKVFKATPKLLELEWPEGGTTEVEFIYIGKRGVLFIPIAGIFEPGKNGSDQIFEFGPGSNMIRLKPKSTVALEGDAAVKGLKFEYALYDEELETFAEGNSPPKMKVGP